MSGASAGLIEFIVVGGLVLGLAVWDLVATHRHGAAPDDPAAEKDSSRDSPDS